MSIIQQDIDDYLLDCCDLVYLTILTQINKWFHSRIANKEIYREYMKGREKPLHEVCGMGLLLYAKFIVNDKCDLDQAFQWSCKSGHLDVAKWLLQLGENGYGKIDIHAINEFSFQWSCRKGYLDLAKWLVHLGENGYSKIDIHAGRDSAFQWSCEGGHIDIAHWLVHLGENGYGKINIHIFLNYHSDIVVHMDILIWLNGWCI